MTQTGPTTNRSWRKKFANSLRGVKRGVRGEGSFFVHFFCAISVVAAGFVLGLSLPQWGLVLVCITMVLSAEMFNTALERLGAIIDEKPNPRLGEVLDIASAAVLITAVGAAAVGALVFLSRLSEMLTS